MNKITVLHKPILMKDWAVVEEYESSLSLLEAAYIYSKLASNHTSRVYSHINEVHLMSGAEVVMKILVEEVKNDG